MRFIFVVVDRFGILEEILRVVIGVSIQCVFRFLSFLTSLLSYKFKIYAHSDWKRLSLFSSIKLVLFIVLRFQ